MIIRVYTSVCVCVIGMYLYCIWFVSLHMLHELKWTYFVVLFLCEK